MGQLAVGHLLIRFSVFVFVGSSHSCQDAQGWYPYGKLITWIIFFSGIRLRYTLRFLDIFSAIDDVEFTIDDFLPVSY